MLYFITAHTEGDNTMIIIRENVLLNEKQTKYQEWSSQNKYGTKNRREFVVQVEIRINITNKGFGKNEMA